MRFPIPGLIPLLIPCLAAAQDAAPVEVPVEVRAELLSGSKWTWQFEPIRCTVRVTNPGKAAVVVVLAPFPGRTDESPFEIERGGKQSTAGPIADRVPGGILPNNGLRIDAGGSRDFELGIRDLAVLEAVGPLRLRLPIRFGPVPPRGKAPRWQGTVHTAWLEQEIRPYPAHAERLGRKPELRAAYARVLAQFWSTMRTAMNRGPFNPGPPNARVWSRITPMYEDILAVKGLSDQVRARALLGMAYASIEEAALTRGEPDVPLKAARKQLAAVRLRDQPPSGGLTPMLAMLRAHVDARLGDEDRRAEVLAEIQEQHPCFAHMWQFEMRQLLQ